MLLNCKQCQKNVNEQHLHLNVFLLSLMIFKIMLMTRMLALMKVYFLFCMPSDANTHRVLFARSETAAVS